MQMLEGQKNLCVPSELVPYCPKCENPMSMNLRCDHTFLQDEGWFSAASRYEDFINGHASGKVLYLELGVGGNTPGVIKYPFWQMTAKNPNAIYVCINLNEAACSSEIKKQSICIDADIGQVIDSLGG